MKKVLIVSYAYPPQNEIASRRFSEMVPFFYKNGWKPFILTTNSSGDLDPVLKKEQIFRVGSHPGLNLNKNNRNNNISSIRRRFGFLFRVMDTALLRWSNEVLYNRKLMTKLKMESFDVIIASYGPSSALRVGNKLSKILDIPVVYDFRDLGALHDGEDYKQNLIAKNIDRKLEAKYLKNAAAILSVSEIFVNRMSERYNKIAEVIYNGWSVPKELEIDNILMISEKPYMYYAGRFYRHRVESVFLVIDSLKFSNYILIIRSLGPKEIEKEIIEFAKDRGVYNQVKILPATTAHIVAYESSKASINLVFESLNKENELMKGVITGKLLQLLVINAPILAVARSDSEIGNILRKTNKGDLVSNEDEIIDFFKKLSFSSKAYKGNSETYLFSKEKQAYNLCKILDDVIDKRD